MLRRTKLTRINDLALTRDGNVMVLVNQEKTIKLQRLFDTNNTSGPRVAPVSSHSCALHQCTYSICQWQVQESHRFTFAFLN